MFIDINTLGPEGLAFDRVLRLCGLDGPSREKLRDVEARLIGSIALREGGKADLSGSLEATLVLQCSRCLEPFTWIARSKFDLTAVRAASEAVESAEDHRDDPSVLPVPRDGRLDLEGVATEQLYLAFPLKPICSPACRGLCPNCGANRSLDPCGCAVETIDPRLAPLLPFRQKKNQEL